jgi:nucleoside-diphosphate-sugar epimerase
MRVLVTGATGFIGSHLVERLLGSGAQLRALVRHGTDASSLEPRGVEVVRGDVRDPETVRHAMADRQVVYHLAVAPRGWRAKMLQAVNVEGTGNVARAAARAGVARLVHASSASVYGEGVRGSAIHEDSPLNPFTEYGRSKLRAEQALRSQHDSAAVPVVFARISTVIGPRAKGWRGLFAAIEAKRFWMPGAGLNYHHIVDVADIVEGLLLCAATPNIEGRAYNLAGPEAIRLRDMLQLIVRELGTGEEPPRALPAGPLQVYRRLSDALEGVTGVALPRAGNIANFMKHRVLDISRARRELGYAPRVSPQEAIRRTTEWYRNAAPPPLHHGTEVSARRGSS